ncbi:serpin family protein [Streptomyces sp. NPDC051909]|uniref:serpin family protein n=1 Tax=Streptomyces sp. NPDC051909 TaxID=3154944 RepID=UPI0034215BBF
MWGSTVRAVNGLTARWATALPASDTASDTAPPTTSPTARDKAPDAAAGEATGTVFSACGVWPLLAFLADGAAGPARAELEDALGVPAERAAEAARDLLAGVERIPGVGSAVGLWTRPDVEPHGSWVAGLPAATLGRLGPDDAENQRELDAWAAKRTDGLIPTMPVTVDETSKLVLAVAQALRTSWLRPFWEGGMLPDSGPWAGRELAALHRTTGLLDRVGVAETDAGPLTVLKVLGGTGIDVHLLLGPDEADRGTVLKGGLDVLSGTCRTVPGDLLPLGEPGPGLNVRHVRSTSRDPYLAVTTSPFSLTAEHDLLAHHEVFGLTTARDLERGHFPGISDFPLALTQAAQATVARFDAQGFEAASVTAFAAAAGCAAPRTRHVVRRIDLDVDRPFGFLAVHRTSRLVLMAGWVNEPVPYVFDEE